ncbi:hypothetical protein ERICIV_00757 [Paenibacillus larvae subsp. larvae]|uniref:Uncharacterized protein n=1 Tax=Paenibacillus larvae subsp. larvae TaxID=147375 RepID=A0A2L1U9X5_9BACL|nr:hypothetical protein ERICIII_00755 [Paenibacillus larvae subsp. larvae]AVF29730.1 hypothetical protein ERICIV_00757 [Paenibacillus larvae subsp. larvae]
MMYITKIEKNRNHPILSINLGTQRLIWPSPVTEDFAFN